MNRWISRTLFPVTFLLAAAQPMAAAADDEVGFNNTIASKIAGPDEVIASRTFGEWSAAWWQWTFSIPRSSNPILDKGNCTVGQTGKVFFLTGFFGASKTVTRHCTVPSGKYLFFPIVNFVEAVPVTPPDTINSFREICQTVIDGATALEADLDGQSIKDLKRFRTQSVVFDLTLPVDNLFSTPPPPVAAGIYPVAVDDGFYLMLRPLSPGKHLLHFHGSIPAFKFTLDITYQLTISS